MTEDQRQRLSEAASNATQKAAKRKGTSGPWDAISDAEGLMAGGETILTYDTPEKAEDLIGHLVGYAGPRPSAFTSANPPPAGATP